MAAILLNALMPTVSLAFVPASQQSLQASTDWVEICTTQGASWVYIGLGGQVLAQTTQKPEGAPAATHTDHCPYCLTHAASFAMVPVPAKVLPPWPRAPDLLPGSAPAFCSVFLCQAPVARGPPTNPERCLPAEDAAGV